MSMFLLFAAILAFAGGLFWAYASRANALREFEVKPGTAPEPLSWLQKLMAGNLLASAGVVLLFFGVASGLKMAADHGLFHPIVRLVLVALAGTALVAFGYARARTPEKESFGYAVQGGGFAVLYLALYSAFVQYGYVIEGNGQASLGIFRRAVLLGFMVPAGAALVAYGYNRAPTTEKTSFGYAAHGGGFAVGCLALYLALVKYGYAPDSGFVDVAILLGALTPLALAGAALVAYGHNRARNPEKVGFGGAAAGVVGGIAMLCLGSYLAVTQPSYLPDGALALLGFALLGIGSTVLALVKKELFGYVAQGVGFAVLYLALPVAFTSTFDMDSYLASPAFIGFALLGIGSTLLALRQNSRVLAGFGIAGAFFAPALSSGEYISPVVLFSHFLLLNLFILGISYHKAGKSLELLGFGLTVLFGGLALATRNIKDYNPVDHWLVGLALACHFLLYTLAPALRARYRRPSRPA